MKIKKLLFALPFLFSLAFGAPCPPQNGCTGISNNNANTITVNSPINFPSAINLQNAYNQSVALSHNYIQLITGGFQILNPSAATQWNIFTESGIDYIIQTGNTFIANTSGDIVPSSAFFQVASTTQGSIPAPLMTQTEEDDISSPVQGMQVFNTTYSTLDYFDNDLSPHKLLAADKIIQGSNMTVTYNEDGSVTLASTGGGSSGTQVQGSFTSGAALSATSVTTSDSPVNVASGYFNAVNAVGTNVNTASVGGVTTAIIQNNSTAARWGMARFDLSMNFQSTVNATYIFTVYTNTGATLFSKQTTLSTSSGVLRDMSLASPLIYLNPGDYVYLTVRQNSGSSSFYSYLFNGSWIDTSIAGIPNTNALAQGSNNLYLSQNGGSTYQYMSGSGIVGNYPKFNSTGGQLIDSGVAAGNVNVTGGPNTNTTYYLPFVPTSSANNEIVYAASSLTFQNQGGVNYLTAPMLNLTNLTASQALVSDIAKNVVSYPYTQNNTPNSIVSRDSSGNFSAAVISSSGLKDSGLSASSLVATDSSMNLTSSVSGLSPTFTGMNLSGLTASSPVFTDASKNLTSTGFIVANNVATNQTSLNTSYYPLFVASSTNSNQAVDLGTGLTFNPSTNNLSTTTFTGALSGNATTATSATTATNSNNSATTSITTNASFYPLFVASSTNSNQALDLGTGLTFNPSINNLSTTTFTGALSGNATTATTATNANNVATTQVSLNASYYPLLVSSSTNSNQAPDLGTGITFNPGTNNLTTTTFTGALSGNATTATSATTATTATNANNVATTQVSSNASYYPLLVSSSTNSNQAPDLGTGITFNPNTNNLATTIFTGALSGNATTATTATNANNVNITSAANSNVTYYPTFVSSSSSGNQSADVSSILSFNPMGNANGTLALSSTNGTMSIKLSSTALSGPSEGAIYFGRGYAGTNTYSQLHYQTAGSDVWATGLRGNSSDYFIFDAVNSLNDYILVPSATTTNIQHQITGNIILEAVGTTVTVPSGTNACSGTGAVMVAGTVTVSTTCAKTNDVIILMKTAAGGTSTVGMPVITISNGTSFTITGASLDTSTWSWMILHSQ